MASVFTAQEQLAARNAQLAFEANRAKALPPCPVELNNTPGQSGVYSWLPPGTVGLYVIAPLPGLSLPMSMFVDAQGRPKSTVSAKIPLTAVGPMALKGLERLWQDGGAEVRAGKKPLAISRGSMKVCLEWCAASTSYGPAMRCSSIADLFSDASGAKLYKTFDVYATKTGHDIIVTVKAVPYSGWQSFMNSLGRKLSSLSDWLCSNAALFTAALPASAQPGMQAYVTAITAQSNTCQRQQAQLPPPPPETPPAAPPWWEHKAVVYGAIGVASLVAVGVVVKSARKRGDALSGVRVRSVDRDRLEEISTSAAHRDAARTLTRKASRLRHQGRGFGRKVWLADLADGQVTPEFARLLTAWHTLGWVELGRADLAAFPDKMAASEVVVDDIGSTFHFLVLPPEDLGRARRARRR